MFSQFRFFHISLFSASILSLLFHPTYALLLSSVFTVRTTINSYAHVDTVLCWSIQETDSNC